ncbi:MAG TPA: hypothetical protein VF219_07270 [Vicinamibacterales bacterium]
MIGLLLVRVSANHHESVPSFPYATPVFGLADIDGSLFVADAGADIVELRNGTGTLIAELPGVTDVAPITRHIMFATTGGNPEGPNPPTARKLYLVAFGKVHEFADLRAFEASVNPDGGAIDSNPFDVAVPPRGLVVADAAANALLSVDCRRGLTMPIAVTEGKKGQIFGLVNALIPGAAAVVPLP